MITIIQAYQATIAFLDTWYFRQYLDELGSFLGDTRLIKNAPDWQNNPITLDDMMWDNWILASSHALNKSVKITDTLTAPQGFEALKHFVRLYISKVKSEELFHFYNDLNQITQNSPMWSLWLQCIRCALDNKLDFINDSLIGEDTKINHNQAIAIMNHFIRHELSNDADLLYLADQLQQTENIPLNNQNQSLNALLENAYQVEGLQLHDQVTVKKLFKVWVKLLELYGNKFQQHTILHLVSQYEYFNNGQPKEYMVYYYWLRAFHEILYPLAACTF